jgi:hypothetical protein
MQRPDAIIINAKIALMNWLSENYKWLFDGVAGAAALSLIGYFIHRFSQPKGQNGNAALNAQGAKVTNSPVASGSNITQTVNSPTTINFALGEATIDRSCDFWLAFDPRGSRPLGIQNNGAEPAFDIVVCIPADGSGFRSDVINRLDNDSHWACCSLKGNFVHLEAIRTILVQAVLRGSADGEEVQRIPVLISYRTRTEQGCEIHLEIRLPLKNGIQFALPENEQSTTRAAWPNEQGVYIVETSEAIPTFPSMLSGYRSEENKDFWNKPFPVEGSIRVFEGGDWTGIWKFPNTMNGCSAGVFMIRWRSADPNVRIRASVRHSSTPDGDEKTGTFGYMSGTNCEQPMFKFAESRHDGTLADVYYELKFWRAAP